MAGTASQGMLLCASKREGEDLSALDLVEAIDHQKPSKKKIQTNYINYI